MDSTKTAALSGILFGIGLAVSQMTNPTKVIGFLDVTSDWDPTLAFVIGGALLVSTIANHVANGRRDPHEPVPYTPPRRIDGQLLAGPALFGVGWGLAGFCPGPALAAHISGSSKVAVFSISMLAGMALLRFTSPIRLALESQRKESSI